MSRFGQYMKQQRPDEPSKKIVEEPKVLIAVSLWLHRKKWVIKSLSVPGNQPRSPWETEQTVRDELKQDGVDYDFVFTQVGPDILAEKDSVTWMIECKGLTSGQRSVLEQDFNRGLVLAVSHYDGDASHRIGLALPRDNRYEALVVKTIKPALVNALDLWLILYDRDTGKVEAYGPEETGDTVDS